MAENYSIAIELQQYDKFIQNAEAVDKVIDKVGKSLTDLATKFNKLDLGSIKFDTKSLESLVNLDLKGKSASLSAIAKQYGVLGEAVKTVDAQKIVEVNKALSGGAKAETITAKATAFGLLGKELAKLEKLSLGIVPSQIRMILDALKSTGDIDLTKINAANPAILTLVKALSKLDTIKVSEDSIRQLNLLSVALNNLGNEKTLSLLGSISPKVKELAESFKSFAKGGKTADIEALPKILQAASDALGKFVAISKQFSGGLFGGSAADNMTKVATAVREMGRAFLEFKTPTDGFSNIEKNITATIAALAKLKDVFSAFTGKSAENVTAAAAAFKALGEAVTSLGRRTQSFESLPTNIEKLNQALQTLNIQRLEQIAPTLSKVGPALKSMADLATVSKNAFAGLGTTAVQSTSSFSVSFGAIKNIVSGAISAFQAIAPVLFTVGKAFLQMPFVFVTSGFKTIAAVILAPIRFLEFLGKTSITVVKELKLLQLGLTILGTPFKFLQGVVTALGIAFNTFIGIIQKVLSFFDRFGGSASKAKTEITNFGTTADNAKNKITGLSSTLDTLDDKTKPVGSAFKQMGSDISGSINDSTTSRFIQFSSSLQAITTIGSAVTNTLRNMAQGFQAFFTAGFDAAASMEDVTRSLNVLTAGDMMRQQTDGSLQLKDAITATAGATQDLLDRYQMFAFASPFGREQLTSAHQLAQSLGFTAAEAENLVLKASDWAAANGLSGDSIKSLILPLGQMNSLTKANTVDMKQLITAGNVPAFELLRQELERVTGAQVTMTEVQALLQAGMVDSDTAINAIVAGFNQFAGVAENSVGTLSGLKNAFGDAKDNIIRGFVTPLLSSEEGLRDLFSSILNPQAILGMTAAATNLGKVFAANVVGVVTKVAYAFKVLNAIWTAIPGPIKETIFFVAKFAATTAALTIGLIALGATLSTIASGIALFASPFSLAAVAVAGFVTTVVTNFSTVKNMVADLLYTFSEIRGITTSVGKALQQVFNTGSFDPKVFDGLSSLSVSLASGLTSGLSTIGTALASTFDLVMQWAGQFGGLALQMYTFGVDTIIAFADGVWAGVGALQNAFLSIAGIFTDWFQPHSPPKIAPDIDTHGIETIAVWVAGLTKGITDYLPDVANTIKPILADVLQVFTAIGFFSFSAVAASLVGLINLFNSVAQVLIGLGGAVVSEVALAISTAVDIISTLINPTLTFKDKFIITFNEIGFFITGTFSNVGFLIQSSVTGILMTLQSLVLFLNDIFTAALISLSLVAPQTFLPILESFISFSSQMMTTMNDFVNSWNDGFSTLLNNMVDYGSGLISSFADGIYATIEVVSGALQSLGEMISYWLAPGSPPKLLPDIDDWGTAAAQEFLGGFSDADISVINEFGDTIGKTLEKLNVDNINVEEVTRAFATGLDNLNKGGEFGSDVMERIVELTGTAGPEVASLTSKFKTLAEEQVKLNRTTEAYNTELKAAQGVLDGLNASEEIGANQKKIDALTNALTNTYLTTEERTKIQTQIDKLQATNKIKQLEGQKKAQEENVNSVKESIDTQTKLLDLSDAFDGSKQANAINKVASATEKQAKKTVDRMTELMLKQKLAGKTTEEQILIYKDYLSGLEEGSEEYVKIQTKIIELEAKLVKEREASVKKLGKEAVLMEKFGGSLGTGSNALSDMSTNFKKKTTEITDSISGMVTTVKALWLNFTSSFTLGKTSEISIPMNFDSLPGTIATVGRTLGTFVKYIEIVGKAFDTYVIKNEYIMNALISLGVVVASLLIASKFKLIAVAFTALLTPMNLVVGGVILLASAIGTFIAKSGGLQAAVKRITDSFTGLTTAFSGGMSSGEATFDLSSFEGIVGTIGSVLGSVVGKARQGFDKFYTNLSKAWQDTITSLSTSISGTWKKFTDLFTNIDLSGWDGIVDFFSKNWLEIITGIADVIIGITLGRWLLLVRGVALIMKNFTIPTDIFSEILVNFVSSVDSYIVQPLIAALSSNGTILGKISAGMAVFYAGVVKLLTTSAAGAFKRLSGSGGFAKRIEDYFNTSALGKTVESNVNEAVQNLVPVIGKDFDLSGFLVTIVTQFNTVKTTLMDAWATIQNIFTTGPLANVLKTNSDAFKEFFTEISSPAFLSALTTIGKSIAAVAGAFLAFAAVLLDVALIAILQNLADMFIVVGQGLDRIFAGFQLLIGGNVLGGVSEVFGGIFDIVNGVFDTIGQVIADAVLAMVSFFNPSWAARLEPVVSMISKIIVQFFGWQGVMTKVFGFLGSLISRFIGLFSRTNTAVGTTGQALTGFQKIIQPLQGVFTNISNAFKAGWQSLLKFGDTVPYVRDLFSSLYKVVQTLLTPFAWLKTGIMNLFSGTKSGATSTGVLTKVLEALKPVVSFVTNIFTSFVNVLRNVWSVVTSLGAPIQTIGQAFMRGATSVLQFVNSVLGFIANSTGLRAVFTWMWDLLSAVGNLFRVFGKLVIQVGTYLFNLGSSFFTALKPIESFKLLFSSISAIASVVGTAISNVIGKVSAFGIIVYNAINNGIQKLLEIDYVQQFVAWAGGWVEAIWTGLATFVTSIPTKIVEWTNALAEWLEPHSPPKFLPDLVTWGTTIGALLLDAIFSAPLTAITTWGTNIGNAILAFDFKQFATQLGTLLVDLVALAISGMTTLISTVWTLGTIVGEAIRDFDYSSFATMIGTNLVALISLAISGMTNLVSTVWTLGTNVGNAIKDFDYTQFATDIGTKLSGMLTTAVSGITAVAIDVGKIITVTPDEENKLAEGIYASIPNVDALFGEDSTKKIAIGLSDLVTFNEAEITTATGYFDKFFDSLASLTNLSAVPAAFTTSIETLIGFFSGDVTFPNLIKTVVAELNKVVNFTAIPEIFVTGLNSIISLFNENATLGDVVTTVVNSLSSFATLVGIPEGVLTSISNIFEFFTAGDIDLTSVEGIRDTFQSFDKLVGIPPSVKAGLESIFTFFTENATIGSVIDSFANAMSKFSSITGIGEGATASFQAIIDLFTGEATFPQTIDTIATALGNIVTNLSTTIGNPFAELDFTTFEASILSIQTIIDGVFETFTSLTTIDLSGISSVFEPLTSLFDSVNEQIENIKTGLSFIPGVNLTGAEVEGTENVNTSVQEALNTAVTDTTIDYEARVNTITDATNLSEESAKVLTAFNDSMATNAGLLDDNLTEVVNGYVTAGFDVEQLKALANEAGVEVPAGIEEAFKNPENWTGANTEAGNQLTNMFAEIKKNLGIESPSTEARDQIGKPIVEGIAEGLATTEGVDFVTPINTLFQTIIATAQTKLTEISTKINIVAALFTLDEAIVATTIASIATMVSIFEEGFTTIDELLQTSMEEWTELFEEFFTTLLEMAEEFVTAFVEVLSDLNRQVSDKIISLIGAIKSFKAKFEEAGKSLAKAFIDGFKEYLGEDGGGRATLEAAVNSLGSFISSGNTTLFDTFTASGSSFAKPFVDGIAKGLEGQKTNARLLAAVQALVQRIIDEARAAAGIASPSKVAAAQIGVPIAQGIGVGLESGVTFVSDGIDTLMKGIGFSNNSIGAGFTSGVAKGIIDSTSSVTNAVRNMANVSVDAAREALDIHSPSRVTRDLIGLPFVQGIANALESGKGMLIPLTSDLLSVLPSDAKFKFDIDAMRMKEQSIDVRYNGLMNSLPELTQDISLNRQAMYNVKAMSLQHEISRYVTNKTSQSFIQGMKQAYVNVSPQIAVMNEMQQARLAQSATGIVVPHQVNKQQVLANTSNMHDNRSTVVNNHNEYHMHLSTSESSAARRVQRNFNSMRYGYRFK